MRKAGKQERRPSADSCLPAFLIVINELHPFPRIASTILGLAARIFIKRLGLK